MKMWDLGETAITDLTAVPETGMGFQLVEAVIGGNVTPLLVFNSEHAVDLSQTELAPGERSRRDPQERATRHRGL